MLWPPESEADITATAESKPLFGCRTTSSGTLHRRGQSFEALDCDDGQEFIFVAEMTIRGIMRDISSARHLAQGKSLGADLTD